MTRTKKRQPRRHARTTLPREATPAAATATTPARRSVLEVLGLPGVDGWQADRLDVLSVGELLAITYDLGEGDPVVSLLAHLHADLLALDLAARSSGTTLSTETVSRILHRLGVMALVAGELHARQRGARGAIPM